LSSVATLRGSSWASPMPNMFFMAAALRREVRDSAEWAGDCLAKSFLAFRC
jgi:hypothetical protein